MKTLFPLLLFFSLSATAQKPLTITQTIKGYTVFDSAGLVRLKAELKKDAGSTAASAELIVGEIAVGEVNGANKVFTLAAKCLPGTEAVFVDGKRIRRGLDYSITTTVNPTRITMKKTPIETVVVDYLK